MPGRFTSFLGVVKAPCTNPTFNYARSIPEVQWQVVTKIILAEVGWLEFAGKGRCACWGLKEDGFNGVLLL